MTEIWQDLERFIAILTTRSVLIEVAAVALCVLAAWLTGAWLRDRDLRRGARCETALTPEHLGSQGTIVIAPVLVALLLAIAARGAAAAAHLDTAVVDGALRMIGAYAAVRIVVFLFAASLGNKSWMQHWEGRVTLAIWFVIAAHYLGWLSPIVDGLESIGISVGKLRITVWSVLKLLFTLTLFVLVAAWLSRWFERSLNKLSTLAPSTRIGIGKFVNAFLIGLSVLLGLNAAGVDLTALTVLTGAIGLGLGFGLQSIAANFVSGFVLLMDRSIKPGDVISFSGQSGTSTENFGWVHELRGRYVVLRDRDGVETLVPNQQLISNPVVNWSYTDPRIRLKLPIRISYADDPELALVVLLEACVGQKRVLNEPPPVSRLMHFSDNGIEMELRFWISDPQEGVNNVRSEVNRAIWRLFKQHGISMPVAQREILVRRASPDLD